MLPIPKLYPPDRASKRPLGSFIILTNRIMSHETKLVSEGDGPSLVGTGRYLSLLLCHQSNDISLGCNTNICDMNTSEQYRVTQAMIFSSIMEQCVSICIRTAVSI